MKQKQKIKFTNLKKYLTKKKHNLTNKKKTYKT